jgi:hypothetical protein
MRLMRRLAGLVGLVGVALLAFVLSSVGLLQASAATPRHTVVGLRTPAQGMIAVAVLRFHVANGARPPRLRIASRFNRATTTAVVLGTARVPGRRASYIGLVSIVNFQGSAQAAGQSTAKPVLYVTASRPFTVDYLGDAGTYRGTMRSKLRIIGFGAWKINAFALPPANVEPTFRNPRTLLDEVKRVLIGTPGPQFLVAVRGPRLSPPPPQPPAPPPPPQPPPGPPPPPALIALSADTFTNTSSQHRAQVEPDSFSFGSTIVAAFQSGRFKDGGSSDIGFATSTNSGADWTSGFLPSLTKYFAYGPFDRATDPSVAYDAKHHVWLITSLAMSETPAVVGVAVVVSRSTDGGLTWGTPVVIGTGTNIDKEWIVCDNHVLSSHYGNCYTEWDDVADGDRIKMSTSSDGGLTWGDPQNTAGNAKGFAGQPLVQPNGRVVVPIVSPDATAIFSFASGDGGATWGNPTQISQITNRSVVGGLRTPPIPSAEIDAAGTIYVVWQDCRFRPPCTSNDIVMSTSSQGGYPTWSPVNRVPIDPPSSGVDHFIPGLAVEPASAGATASLALAYYYYPDANCTTCQLDVGFISSGDGGATWSPSSQIAGPMSLNWLPITTGGLMVGDYISTSFSAGIAHPFFALAQAPSDGSLNEAIYTR